MGNKETDDKIIAEFKRVDAMADEFRHQIDLSAELGPLTQSRILAEYWKHKRDNMLVASKSGGKKNARI